MTRVEIKANVSGRQFCECIALAMDIVKEVEKCRNDVPGLVLGEGVLLEQFLEGYGLEGFGYQIEVLAVLKGSEYFDYVLVCALGQ